MYTTLNPVQDQLHCANRESAVQFYSFFSLLTDQV